MTFINNFYQIGLEDNIKLEYIIEHVILMLFIAIASLVIKRFNFITLILAVETIVITLVTIIISLYLITEDISIEIYILYILGILAVETGIVLAIIIKYYQKNKESDLQYIEKIKG
jgi:NADH:ubiquinone oxidoreductase subunit K